MITSKTSFSYFSISISKWDVSTTNALLFSSVGVYEFSFCTLAPLSINSSMAAFNAFKRLPFLNLPDYSKDYYSKTLEELFWCSMFLILDGSFLVLFGSKVCLKVIYFT